MPNTAQIIRAVGTLLQQSPSTEPLTKIEVLCEGEENTVCNMPMYQCPLTVEVPNARTIASILVVLNGYCLTKFNLSDHPEALLDNNTIRLFQTSSEEKPWALNPGTEVLATHTNGDKETFQVKPHPDATVREAVVVQPFTGPVNVLLRKNSLTADQLKIAQSSLQMLESSVYPTHIVMVSETLNLLADLYAHYYLANGNCEASQELRHTTQFLQFWIAFRNSQWTERDSNSDIFRQAAALSLSNFMKKTSGP